MAERREPLGAREAAAQVAARLEAAGHVAYFAGGCVRDELLGLVPADYDVATGADPDAVRAVFPNARGVGEHFGVMLVRLGGRTIEVATFRGEGAYSDGRRPEAVHFSDERTDALRRDFTVNGLFLHAATGRLVDHVGGRADLDARVLRAIGDADARLQEDRLRLLLAAPVVRCDEIAWSFAGLSMAGWNALASLAFAGLGVLAWRWEGKRS